MKIISIIPARMGSSRFPGKPMAFINGRPMIEHVFRRVKKNKFLDEVIVATCDKVIFNFIKSIGGSAIMTSKKHKRASDRCYEALAILEKKKKIKFDIIVMVQGDEPMVHPNMISDAIKPMLKDRSINVVNLISKIQNQKDFKDPNFIKVVHDKNYNALYFSRSAIPNLISKDKLVAKKQVCIIPFRRNFLIQYNKMKPTRLEVLESIDMLRILENGFKVKLYPTKYFSHAVDTKKDLLKVERYLKKNDF